MTTYLLVSSALCVLVVVVVANHSATSTKQPNKHKQSSNTHNDVDSTFQPSGSHCDPGYKVKSKNTHKQPVESANNCKYKRNYIKHNLVIRHSFYTQFPQFIHLKNEINS